MSRSVLAANSEIEPMLIHPQLGGIETINNNMTIKQNRNNERTYKN
jgi:hypothetical protein